MKLLKFSAIIIVFISFTISSCKQDNTTSSKNEVTKKVDIIKTQEFETYFEWLFKLSDKNTKTDLPYVNNFMKENKLFPFKDVCDLLQNDVIIANKRVFDYWKIRCEFQTAKNVLMRKYEIDGDSIKELTQEAILDKR